MVMRLKFNNDWMQLFAKSMGKVYHITYICSDKNEMDNLFKQKDLITVSTLPQYSDECLITNAYAFEFRSCLLEDISSDIKCFTDLYIKSDKQFYQVAGVSSDVNEMNLICESRNDVGIIATDNAKRHYLASLKPVSLKS